MSGATPLGYQVVFWDSEAPGFEGNRIQFSEKHVLPVDTTKASSGAWRSDRRCQFPLEIGLRLQAPCRLQELVLVSEPALAPSAVECFVAGPTRSKSEALRRGQGKRSLATSAGGMDRRHNGSTTASTDAARAGYLSSVFVWAGRAEFSRAKTEIVAANGTDSSRTEGLRQNSETVPNDATMTAGAPSVAVLSGLTFKCQFLRLVLWEAAGSSDNPGRQVSVARIQVSGYPLSEEGQLGKPKPSAQNRKEAAGGTPSFLGEDGDHDRELEQVLLDLGIEPLLAQGPSGNKRARDWGELGRRGVARGSSGSDAVHALDGKGWGGAERAVEEAEDGSAAEAMKKVKQMLHIARSEERFHEAEMLSLQLDRVRSLASTLCSARRAQERAARRENFDQAKRFRDDAREAEVWLRQTIRDASDIYAGGDGRSSRQEAEPPLAADTAPVAGTDVQSASSPTPGTDLQELAPSHDAGSNHSTEQTPGEGNPNDLAGKVVGRRPSSGDGSERGAHDKDRPPWLSPACPRSAQPWRVLLKLPWPAGVQPDFRTVFSHKWGSSTVKAYRNHSAATELGGGSTSRSALQPGGLLRTILRLVAASQDLRPPGPVPPDTVPFRQAGSVYGRPPLCTFFLSPENLADGGGGGDGEAAKAGKNRVPGYKSNDEVVGQVKEIGRKRRAGAREGGVAISGGGQTFTDEENGGAEGAAVLQAGDLGRAFGHPAADSSPAATHVVNFIEDNPGLAWSSSALRGPRRRSVHYLRHARGDDHESRHDEATSASGAEAGRKTAKGKRRRSKADEDGDEKSAVEGARIRSKKRGEGDRQGGTETVVAVGSEVVSRERLREEATASSTSAAAVLPDVVGAGGFAEFIPLLDTIFGRVPMSAACVGFPARMRESSIRLCQAHLGLTADAAVEACMAATASSLVSTTATATTSITAQPTSSLSNGRPPALGTATQRDSETGKKRGSQAALSGELKAEELKSHRTNASNDSRESESRSSSKRSCSSSSSSSAIGAVVRAACLVAAQGLMDPKKEVRLAGADLARAALSLCSSVPVAVEEGVGDKEEAETAVVDAAAARRSSATAKKGSTSDEDHGIVGDDHACGNAAVQGRGSVGSDDGASGYTMSSSEAASDSEDKERPQARAAQSDSARIGSKQEPQGSSPRISVGGSAASPASAEVRAAVPLRDLRWGLELILACVAPYLTNRDVVSPEKRGERVMPTTAGSAAGSVGDNSGRCSTSAFTDSGRNAVSTPSEDIAGNALDGTSAEEGEDSGDGCIRYDKEEREELAQSAGDSPLAKEDEPGEDCQDDADRSLLALRVVDFACRHPDIGPALVSSVLVGWIPCLAQWGRNTPSSASPDRNHTKIGRVSMPRSPRCAAFTVGEAAASEALAAGAIEMIVFMVNNFPLLPLSDFSAETLVAAAEGGMAFAGRTRSTSAGDGNGRQRDGVGGRRRDGEATGGSGVAAAAARRRAGEDVRRGSINGRAKKAGEALMLELFLRTSGGGHGGLDLGIDCCLESLLPALNTARGINFLDKTAATADLRVSETRRADELEKALKTGVLERGGQGKGGLEEGNKSHGTRSGNRASTRAVRKGGERAIKWPSRRCPFASKVEVRQRLALPPTPPTTNPLADRSLSSSAVSNDRSGAAENGKQNASTSSEHGEVCHLARHDTTPGVYPHMSDSSSAEARSASTAKSAASLVSAGGGGAATAPGGVHGDDDSSSFASFSHGSLSSTSLEDGSGADGGSNTDSTAATGRKPGEVTAETKKQQAAAAHDDRSVKQAAVAEINRSSTKVFPLLSFGGKKSNDVEDPGRNDFDEQTSVGNAKTVTAEEKPAGKPAGAAKPKKGGGGFVSKLFGRGKK